MLKTIFGDDINPQVPTRLLKIAEDIRAAGGRAYLVGGFVRDTLLGNADSRDYDIEVYKISQETLLSILSKYGRADAVGRAFGVYHLSMKGLSLDFSFPRTESKVGRGHKGFVVETHTDLSFKEAAFRRDFTVNAMGMELPTFELNDPYNGESDLRNSILRHVGSAFAEDSLRILRGVQFASRFHLNLAQETRELCRSLSLDDLSKERIYEEFKKWLLKPGLRSLGLKTFLDMDLLRFFPEILPLNNSYELLGEYLDNVSDVAKDFDEESRMILAFASLLAGNAIPAESVKFLDKMTNEIKILKGVPLLLEHAPKILTVIKDPDKFPTDSEIRRLSVTLNGLRNFTAFVSANPVNNVDARQTFAKKFESKARELEVFDKAPEPFLTGRFLMSLGLKPGKQFGELIKASFELQLDGKLSNSCDAEKWACSMVL